MNDKRREKLKEALALFQAGERIIEQILDKEQDCVYNYPENLQSTEVFERMENAVEELQEAVSCCTELQTHISLAIS